MKSGLPIRVLCVFSRLDYGGAETMCMNLYRNIDKEKVQFDFVKHTHDECIYEDEIVSQGGRIYEAPIYRIYNNISYCKWWEKHLHAHPEHRIIHGYYFTVSSIYFRVAKKANCITIGHSHTANPVRSGFTDTLKDMMCKKVEQYSDYAFACGQTAGKWLFPQKKFNVLNNAVAAEEFSFNSGVRKMVREEFGWDTELVIGTVGRLNFAKNPYGILEIVERTYRKRQDIKFLWVGDGEAKNEIENEIGKRGLSSCIVLTGARKDVARLLQAMDVFILPSIFEGLPTAVIEAQASGLPCFISDTVTREAQITELCKFIPLDDFDAWIDGILQIDITKRKDTQQQIVAAGYDVHTTAEWLEKFYIDIYEANFDFIHT